MPVRAVPTQLPVGDGEDFNGVVDLTSMRSSSWRASHASDGSGTEVSGDMLTLAKEWRVKLEKTAAASDDEPVSIYDEGKTPSTEQFIGTICRATISKLIMPIVVGATSPGVGVEPLLNAVCDYFPSPTEAAPKPGPERKVPFFLVAKLAAANGMPMRQRSFAHARRK